jgi:glucokinase
MAKVAKRMLAAACRRGEKTSLCPHRKPTSPDAREIWKAAQHGDALAQRIVEVTGEKLGEVLAVLIDLLNPARIVIGGLAVRMRESLLRPARTVAQREALDATFRPCKIVPAKLGEEIGDIAAICVALDAERRPDSRSEKR